MITTAEDAFANANKLFVDEAFSEALSEYTEAIELSSNDKPLLQSEYYEKRATCHLKLDNYKDAISDSDTAIKLNPNNASAFLKRGMAYFSLENYESAKQSFEQGLKLDPTNSKIKMWLSKTLAELKPSTTSTTSKPSTTAPTPVQSTPAPTQPTSTATTTTTLAPTPTPAPQEQAPVSLPPSSKIKYNFYQNNTDIVVGVLGLKDVKSDARKVEITPNKLNMVMTLAEHNDQWARSLDLFAEIIPEQSTVTHMSVKTEITLKKKQPGVEWKQLEKSLDASSSVTVNTFPSFAMPSVQDPKVYPSSRGAKNWNAIEEEAKKDDKDDGDPLSKLFQQIYSNADEDTRRAMIKSYTESSGTVLSTNWKEVGKDKVKIEPPTGQEPKKWS